MITRRFKKFFKKVKENSKKKNDSKPRSNDREQFTGCFKCGKCDHIMKNCPLLKEEHEIEQFQNQGVNQFQNSSVRHFSKAMLATWCGTMEKMRPLKKKKLELHSWPGVSRIQIMSQWIVYPNLRKRHVVLMITAIFA